jgi:alpha-tubulin suppressor-like RCC1 family protein
MTPSYYYYYPSTINKPTKNNVFLFIQLVSATLATAATTTIPSLTITPIQMSAGDGFGCTIRNDYRIMCQGFNFYGQIGDGSRDDRVNTKKVIQENGEDFLGKQVSCGSTHTCAIQQDTSLVYCWGSTEAGEVGLNPQDTATPPQAQVYPNLVSSTLFAKKICTGQYYSCAIRKDDSNLLCWGSNSFGTLGREVNTGVPFGTPRSSPSVVLNVGRILDVSCGNMHVCYIADDGKGTLGCHGFDNFGQIPNGDLWNVDVDPIWSFVGTKSVATGMWHTCIVSRDGQLYCSGSGSSYQNGGTDPSTVLENLTLVPLLGSNNNDNILLASSVQAGREFTVVLMSDNTARFFGANANGQSGDGTTVVKKTPIPFAKGSVIAGLDAGMYFVMFYGPDLIPKVVGKNDHGACGQGSLSPGGFSSPVVLNIGVTITTSSPTVTHKPTLPPTTHRPTTEPSTRKPSTLKPTMGTLNA